MSDGRSGHVIVDANHHSTYAMLAEDCGAFRYTSTWRKADDEQNPGACPSAIWDVDCRECSDWIRIERFVRVFSPVPVVVVIGFPRWDDWLCANELGVRLLAKPFQILDL